MRVMVSINIFRVSICQASRFAEWLATDGGVVEVAASQLEKILNEYAEVVDGVGPHLRAGCHGGQDLQVHARSVSRC